MCGSDKIKLTPVTLSCRPTSSFAPAVFKTCSLFCTVHEMIATGVMVAWPASSTVDLQASPLLFQQGLDHHMKGWLTAELLNGRLAPRKPRSKPSKNGIICCGITLFLTHIIRATGLGHNHIYGKARLCMCAEKANMSHKQLWGRDKQKNATFAHKTVFFIGKSWKINTNNDRLPPWFSQQVAENNIVYSSEWLLVWNTSVITKQNKCNVYSLLHKCYFFNCLFSIAILWECFQCQQRGNLNEK